MKQLALFVTLTLAMAAAHAEVYRCKSSSGQIVYSQTPCAGEATVVKQANTKEPTEAEVKEARARAQNEAQKAKSIEREEEASRQGGGYTVTRSTPAPSTTTYGQSYSPHTSSPDEPGAGKSKRRIGGYIVK